MATLPPSYEATRRSVHALAEHVLCSVRHAATGRIGLVPLADGVATPPFDGRQVGLRGSELFDRAGSEERRAPVTTIAAAASFYGIRPGPPPLWTATTNPDADAALEVDVAAVRVMGGWFAALTDALAAFAPGAAPTLWPEHFDLAIELNGATFGGSPGDHHHAEPYAYVVPPADPVPDGDREFWNATFGASRARRDLDGTAELVAFFSEARERLEHS